MVLTLSLPEFSCLSKLRSGGPVEAANAALALLRITHAEPSSHMRIAVHALLTVLRGLLAFSGSSQETVLLKLSLFFLVLALHTTAFVVASAYAIVLTGASAQAVVESRAAVWSAGCVLAMGAPTLITLAAHMFEFNRSQLRTGASGANKEDTQEQRFGHFFIVVILCVFFSVVTAAATLGPFIAACTYLGVPLGLCAVSVAQGELQLYLATEEASSLVWARPAAWLARALPLLPAALLYLRQF